MDDPEPSRRKKFARLWQLAVLMTNLGWSLLIPIVGGALLGTYLDKMTGQGLAWTVGLVFAGVALSLYNLYRILFKETVE